MKITNSSENINLFDGFNFADYIVKSALVYKTIDSILCGRG